MIQKNRPFRSFLLATLLCGTASVSLLAQEADSPAGARGHHGPPPSPLFDALDANHDGVISTEEMTNAPGALKGLLKPGSNELRREDLRPTPHDPRIEEDGTPGPDHAERLHRRPMMHRHHLPPAAEDQEADAPDRDRSDAEDAPRPHRRGGPDMEETPRPRHHDGPGAEDASRPHPHDGPDADRGPRLHPHDGPDAEEAPRPRHHGGPEADRAPRPQGSDMDKAPRPGGPETGEAGQPPRPHGGPRPNPVFDALDTDGNGILSSEELNRSGDTLKGFLKDGVTELRREDLRRTPPQPEQPQPQFQPQPPSSAPQQ